MSNDAAMDAAEQSLREQWPELSAKEACNEAVAAIANATANHPLGSMPSKKSADCSVRDSGSYGNGSPSGFSDGR
jgi:hypothetical protein